MSKRFEKTLAFIAAAFVLLIVFFVGIQVIYPPTEWDVFTVFDVEYKTSSQITIVLTYGHGKYRLRGIHPLELDHTYYLEYHPPIDAATVIKLMEVTG